MALEIFGYAASVLVAISLMMSNIFKLRVINAIGAAIFSVYGFLLGVWPVFVLNGFIVIADLYYLWKMHNHQDYFEYLSVNPFESQYLHKFLETYKDDIDDFFPAFSLASLENIDKSKVGAGIILSGLTPAGLFIYERRGKSVYIKLDYTTPDYRNLKVSKFLYSSFKGILNDDRCSEYIVEDVSLNENGYFVKIGFVWMGGYFKMDI